MKKNKFTEIGKAAAASVLAVGLFSTAFIGINNLAFAAATGEKENLPPVTSQVGAPIPVSASAELTSSEPAETEAQGGYKIPSLNVIVDDNEWYTPDENAMSPEDAALIGAEYIYDMFGADIDGYAVSMFYSAPDFSTRAYWFGTVAETPEDLRFDPVVSVIGDFDDESDFNMEVTSGSGNVSVFRATSEDEDMPERLYGNTAERNINVNGDVPDTEIQRETTVVIGGGDTFNPLYTFNICAVSGERIDISRFTNPMPEEVMDVIRERGADAMIAARSRTMDPTPEQIAEYTKVAREYAEKHFAGKKVVSVEYGYAYAHGWGLDENGDIIATGYILTFTAKDETGREGDIIIEMETKKLNSITTQMNDIVPGWNYLTAEAGVG